MISSSCPNNHFWSTHFWSTHLWSSTHFSSGIHIWGSFRTRTHFWSGIRICHLCSTLCRRNDVCGVRNNRAANHASYPARVWNRCLNQTGCGPLIWRYGRKCLFQQPPRCQVRRRTQQESQSSFSFCDVLQSEECNVIYKNYRICIVSWDPTKPVVLISYCIPAVH